MSCPSSVHGIKKETIFSKKCAVAVEPTPRPMMPRPMKPTDFADMFYSIKKKKKKKKKHTHTHTQEEKKRKEKRKIKKNKEKKKKIKK